MTRTLSRSIVAATKLWCFCALVASSALASAAQDATAEETRDAVVVSDWNYALTRGQLTSFLEYAYSGRVTNLTVRHNYWNIGWMPPHVAKRLIRFRLDSPINGAAYDVSCVLRVYSGPTIGSTRGFISASECSSPTAAVARRGALLEDYTRVLLPLGLQ